MTDEFDRPEDPEDPDDFDDEQLDERESAMVAQDLSDLADFEATFRPEGYRGVAIWCHDCAEDHYYPWDMLKENLELLLQTGETPVHEPAYAPEPDRYVPWDYARGYVDSLRDVGVDQRAGVGTCAQCGLELAADLQRSNFCPRCGMPLIRGRIGEVLRRRGLREDDVDRVLREIGLPG